MKRALMVAALCLVPSVAHASSSCHEVSDVVGERKCSRFGDLWAHERSLPIVLGVGFVRATIAPDDRHWTATAGKGKPTAYEFDGTALGRSFDMWGPVLNVRGYFAPWLYMGAEWTFLFGHTSTAMTADGYRVESRDGLNALGGRFGFVFGTGTMIGHTVGIRAEALTGLELLTLSQRGDPGTGAIAMGASHADFLLTTRMLVDLWTTPWTAITAYVGAKPLHLNDLDLGLQLSIHGRPHDH
jgi:hypothetical protein